MSQPDDIRDELITLFDAPVFKDAHRGGRISTEELRAIALDMMWATLDESRVLHAEKFAREVLWMDDIDDAMHFRDGVRRRELSASIAYPKQRDHALHTAYNYLLGWYIYQRNPAYRSAFKAAVECRGKKITSDEIVAGIFRSVWSYASLLHDVGYLFEGGLQQLDTGTIPKEVREGAAIASDYFTGRFWHEIRVTSLEHRHGLLQATGVKTPSIHAPASLFDLAAGLSDLGDLSDLQKAVATGLKDKQFKKLQDGTSFSRDVFDLWIENYKWSNQDHSIDEDSQSMERRCEIMRDIFYDDLADGMPGAGPRVMNHGVTGGMLLAQYATWYYKVHATAAKEELKKSAAVQEFTKRCGERQKARDLCRHERSLGDEGLEENPSSGSSGYDSYQWWNRILWATAAVALHDVMQNANNLEGRKEPRRGGNGPIESLKPLRLQDDPLAYLGILVDTIQAWDRYPVRRLSAGRSPTEDPATGLPLESRQVGLHTADECPEISLPNGAREKCLDELSVSLIDVESVIKVSIRKA